MMRDGEKKTFNVKKNLHIDQSGIFTLLGGQGGTLAPVRNMWIFPMF
jgi:hypothetical protein